MIRALGAARSPLRRRWRAPNLAGVALATAIALSAAPSLAQTPPPDRNNPAAFGSDLLQPVPLEGDKTKLPRFRRPGRAAPPAADEAPPPGKFTAPSRIGATPIYGSPNGFGAGDTGFDSLNTPRSKKKKAAQTGTPAPAQLPAPGALVPQPPDTTFAPVPTFNPAAPPTPPAPAKPPPPDIYPKRAAMRIGAILPPPPDELPVSNPPAEVHPFSAANRPGAVVPIPPPEYFNYSASTPPPTLPPPNTLPLGTIPLRLLPLADNDPYAALGIRAGSFLLLPALDLSGAYTTNAERIPGGGGSPYVVVAPALQVRSDWERHSLTADITGSYTQYAEDLTPSLNVPNLNSKIDGRIDFTRDTQINLEGRVIVNTDNPGSPNLQLQAVNLPVNTDVGETIGIAQQFNRLLLSFKSTFDRAMYNPSLLSDGSSSSNSDRNFDQYAGIARIGYEVDPGFKPFVEVEVDQRIHDEQFDRNNLQRDSVGGSAKVGSALDMFGSLTGEMAIGYVERNYADPTLPNVTGVIGDGTLIWRPTALTTYKLAATSQVYETTLAGAPAELSRDVNLQIDHAFRYWLIGTLKGGYGNDDYVGLETDNRWFLMAGLTYKFTREFAVDAQVRQDWQTSAVPSLAYTATSFLLGVHLQR